MRREGYVTLVLSQVTVFLSAADAKLAVGKVGME